MPQEEYRREESNYVLRLELQRARATWEQERLELQRENTSLRRQIQRLERALKQVRREDEQARQEETTSALAARSVMKLTRRARRDDLDKTEPAALVAWWQEWLLAPLEPFNVTRVLSLAGLGLGVQDLRPRRPRRPGPETR